MSKNSTHRTNAFRPLTMPIDPGIETRFGSRVYRVRGIDHDEREWWVELTLTDNPKIAHEYHPAYLVHDDTQEASDNMKSISKAIMDMLAEDGEWNHRGMWLANGASDPFPV